MLSLTLKSTPYHTLPYFDAAAGGGRVRKDLPFLRGQVRGLPAGAPSLVALADLQGRAELDADPTSLLGCAVAADLPAIQAAAGLPPPLHSMGLLAGDLYTVPGADRRGGTGDVTAVWQHAAACFSSLAGVRGNHDLLPEPPPTCLDGGVVTLAGLRIGGVSGIVGDPARVNRHRAEAFAALLARVIAANPHVIVLHLSPRIDAIHRGDEIVRQTLERLDYAGLVISGHLHWPQRVHTIGRATVLNVHEAVVTLEMVG